jgi:hypothetical protein
MAERTTILVTSPRGTPTPKVPSPTLTPDETNQPSARATTEDSDQKQEIISVDSGNSDDSDGLLKRNEDKEDDSDDSADYRILDDINTPDKNNEENESTDEENDQ